MLFTSRRINDRETLLNEQRRYFSVNLDRIKVQNRFNLKIMNKYRVIRQKIVAANGRATAAASSHVVANDNCSAEIKQSVSVKVNRTSSSSSSSSSSSRVH